ncbi:MAG: hypothetical protein ACRDUW_03000 [Pseudonocardiaceae bacterium]
MGTSHAAAITASPWRAQLSLHAAGIEVRVVEAARELWALGVGINVLPHATRELVELGLADELAATGIPSKELISHDRFGSRICVAGC